MEVASEELLLNIDTQDLEGMEIDDSEVEALLFDEPCVQIHLPLEHEQSNSHQDPPLPPDQNKSASAEPNKARDTARRKPSSSRTKQFEKQSARESRKKEEKVYPHASREEALLAKKKKKHLRNKTRIKNRNQEEKLKKTGPHINITETTGPSSSTSDLLYHQISLESGQYVQKTHTKQLVKNSATSTGPVPSNVLEAEADDSLIDDDFDYLLDSDSPDEEELIQNARRTQKQPRPNPQQVYLPMASASSIPPPTERTLQYHFESLSTKLGAQATQDGWAMLEREILLKDFERPDFPIQKMEPTSWTRLEGHLKKHRHYATEQRPNDAFYLDYEPSDEARRFVEFLAEVKKTRTLCVNTEGKQAWINEDAGRRPRVLVSFGTLSGRILFFNDIKNVPQTLLNCLSDLSITKIGSGLDNEFSELARVDLKLSNWVETGALRLALYPKAWKTYAANSTDETKACKYGIEEQINDLKEAEFYPADYKRTPYKYTWQTQVSKGIIPSQMMPHLIENIRVPCAMAILVVIDFAKRRGYESEVPFLPILHEAFDICRSRDPVAFQVNLGRLAHQRDHWMSHPSTGSGAVQSSLPAMCFAVVQSRRAFADFVEPYFTEDPRVTAQEIYERFTGSDALDIPSYREMNKPVDIMLSQRCGCCGSRDHLENCPKVPSPICNYDHDGVTGLRPHTTMFCPILHGYCPKCQVCGHQERVHFIPEVMKTSRELRQRYFRFMAQGAYTSLPFLALHPEGRKRLTVLHWRRSYDGRSFRHAVITRYALGIDPGEECQSLLKIQDKPDGWLKTREEQLAIIRQNMKTTKAGERVPLPIQSSRMTDV